MVFPARRPVLTQGHLSVRCPQWKHGAQLRPGDLEHVGVQGPTGERGPFPITWLLGCLSLTQTCLSSCVESVLGCGPPEVTWRQRSE